MYIAETFHSIQGEGALTGTPSFFIRTSGCNLRCRWCDTPYASWNPEGTQRSVDSILEEAASRPAFRHVVLTGGEPLLAKEIHDLAQSFRTAGHHITIETAGTLAPDNIPCDLASLSPKLSNSTPPPNSLPEAQRQRHESQRLNPRVIAAWLRHCDYQLKFVVSQKSDLDEIHRLLEAINQEGVRPIPSRVFLMPEGITETELQSKRAWLPQICQETGFRLCERMHILWFGNRRGT
jgi:7-carboxy-7-deazaguanine synthase